MLAGCSSLSSPSSFTPPPYSPTLVYSISNVAKSAQPCSATEYNSKCCTQGWQWKFTKVVINGVVEENSAAGGHAGATARGQHTRAQAHVQPERGVRQASAQSAHVRVRKTAVPDRNAQAGHHVHRVHDRTSPVYPVTRWRRRCCPVTRVRGVRSAAPTPRHSLRAVLFDSARLDEWYRCVGTVPTVSHHSRRVILRSCAYSVQYKHI